MDHGWTRHASRYPRDDAMPFNNRVKAEVLRYVEGCGHNCQIVRANDFHVVFDPGREAFRVECLPDPAYSFLLEPDPRQSTWKSTEAPGEAKAEEHRVYRSFEDVRDALWEWAYRVDQELLALPWIRQLGEATSRVAELEKLLEGVPDRYATKDELEALRRRLDELERRTTETMRAGADATEDIEAAVLRLHADVEAMKGSVPHMSLRTVARWVALRFWGYIKNPNAAAEITSAIESMKALGTGLG